MDLIVAWERDATTGTIGPSLNGGKWYSFRFTDMPEPWRNSMAALYSYYRLRKVVFKVFPTFGKKDMNTSTDVTGTETQIYYDSPLLFRKAYLGNVLTQYSEDGGYAKMRSDNNVRTLSMWKPHTLTVYPAIEMIGYETADPPAFAYVSKWGQWLTTTGDQAVPYWGAHFCADPTAMLGVFISSNQERYAQKWNIKVYYYWEFKDLIVIQ